MVSSDRTVFPSGDLHGGLYSSHQLDIGVQRGNGGEVEMCPTDLRSLIMGSGHMYTGGSGRTTRIP